MKNHIVSIGLSLVQLFCVWTISLGAASEPVKVRVGAYKEKPFGWLDEGGNPKGLVYDIIASALREIGENNVELDLVLSSNDRIDFELMSGRIDIAFSYVSPELQKATIFLSKAIPTKIVMASRKELPINSFASADNYSIVTTPPYRRLVPEEKLKVIPRTSHLLHLIISGRAQAAISSWTTLSYQVERENMDLDEFNWVEVANIQAHVVCSRRSEIFEHCKRWQGKLTEVFSLQYAEDVLMQLLDEES